MRRDNLKAVDYIEEDCHGDKSPRNDSWSGFVREIATAVVPHRNHIKKPLRFGMAFSIIDYL